MGEGGHRLEEFIDVVQMRHQLEPEGDFGGPVVVSDARLQANVEVQLLFRSVLRPGHLFKSVGLRVDELGVLRNWLIWITENTNTKILLSSCKRYGSAAFKQKKKFPSEHLVFQTEVIRLKKIYIYIYI